MLLRSYVLGTPRPRDRNFGKLARCVWLSSCVIKETPGKANRCVHLSEETGPAINSFVAVKGQSKYISELIFTTRQHSDDSCEKETYLR